MLTRTCINQSPIKVVPITLVHDNFSNIQWNNGDIIAGIEYICAATLKGRWVGLLIVSKHFSNIL